MDARVIKMICMIPVVVCILLNAAGICVADIPLFDAALTTRLCTERALPNGYPCQEFTVTTSDGYILAIQRIQYGSAGPENGLSRPPVILGAGVFQQAALWLLNPPEQSLGFILADKGFDVWFLNFRGTAESSKHVSLSIEDKAFWIWSFDELASFDVPAALQLVNQTTGSQAFYIGHSQGTTIGLAALVDPSVRQMLKAAVLLSPIAYLSQTTSQLAVAFSQMYLDQVYLLSGARQFDMSAGSLASGLIDRACREIDCGFTLNSFTGPNSEFNSSRMGFYTTFMPEPTSANNVAHLAQLIRNDGFRKYDMGEEGNMNKYGQATPPEYDLSSIPKEFPILIASGGWDHLSDLVDVQNLIYNLRCNVKTLYLPRYGHTDYVLGTNASTEAFTQVIDFLRSV